MTHDAWIGKLVRWILVPCASIGAWLATVYIAVFLFIIGPLPRALESPTTGFLMGCLMVVAGSCVAPSHRVGTAVVLFLFAALPTSVLQGFHLPSVSVGGLFAIALVAWWFHSSRSPRSLLCVGLAGCGVVMAFIGVVYAYHVDRPARPDPVPFRLSRQLGAEASRIGTFYEYDLGGFIDHQWLWRIEAEPDVMAQIVADLKLQPTQVVPPRFWRMPPHYWPRSRPTGADAFQSPHFASDERGPDGEHYFLLQDKAQNKAFVWFKDNF